MTSTIETAVAEASAWADLEGVVMVAQGTADGRDRIEVHLSCRRAELEKELPDTLLGYSVVFFEQSEEIRTH